MPPARLIPFLAGSGHLQMAIDQWLLSDYDPSEWSLVLRFYQWQPAAISLGYSQHHCPDRWQTLQWLGNALPLVRRPTGGRGVLHQGDLCYALVTAPAPGGKPNRLATYHHLCQFLQRGWMTLGFPLTYGSDRPVRADNQRCSNCFALSTAADLRLSNGCKWVGSAQRWRTGSPEVVLQHGSMRLSPDSQLWQQVFGTPLPPPPLDPPIPPVETIVSTLTDAASEYFQVPLIHQPLSQAEWSGIGDSFEF